MSQSLKGFPSFGNFLGVRVDRFSELKVVGRCGEAHGTQL